MAIELALREPVRVKKLVLISTTPCFVKRENWQWGMEASMLQLFAQNLKRDYATTMKRFLTLQVSGGSDSSSILSQLRKSLAERREPDEAALEAGLQILLTSDLREKLKYIGQPVLLLHGENDVITHPNAAKWMNGQLQKSELIMLPTAVMRLFYPIPDQFVESMVRLDGGNIWALNNCGELRPILSISAGCAKLSSCAAPHYDQAAVLQREVCDRMLSRLDYIKYKPDVILDAGSGTGYGTRKLLMRYPAARMLAIDIAASMHLQARPPGSLVAQYCSCITRAEIRPIYVGR